MIKPQLSLWLLNHQASLVSTAQLLDKLQSPQQQRASTIGGKKRRREFALSRLLLTHAINSTANLSGRPFSIIERVDQAPIVSMENMSRAKNGDVVIPAISISHSTPWVGLILAVGLTNDEVIGLDIQTHRANLNDEKARYFCNDEQLAKSAKITNREEKQKHLTRLWTQKEAFFKAFGTSVFNPKLKPVDFSIDPHMHSSSLDTFTELSIYCNFSSDPTQLIDDMNTHSIALSRTGELLTSNPTAARIDTDFELFK